MTTTTIVTILTDAIDQAQDVFTVALPYLVTFAVGLLIFWTLWRKIRGVMTR